MREVIPAVGIADLFRSYLIEEGCAFSQCRSVDFLKEANLYLKTIEEFIDQEKSAEIALLSIEANRLPVDYQGKFWSNYYPVHWEEIFEAQLHSSFVVLLASFVENYIKTLSWEVSKIVGATDVDPRRWSCKILSKLKQFLQKRGGFKTPSEVKWNFLFDLYRLRNVFVHNGGHINGSSQYQQLAKFVRKQCGLSEKNGFISVSKEFCFHSLQFVEQIVNDLQREQTKLCEDASESTSNLESRKIQN